MVTETQQAFNLRDEVHALQYCSDIASWRTRVDTNLQYFTREYIVEENITRFSYGLKRGENGLPNQIYSIGYESDGDILESFKRGQGLRARAECIGFGQKIEQPLFNGKVENNDFFVWHSPPGKKEDGFKDHNFTFIGQVLDDRVDMVAYRNHLCHEDSVNFLNKFLSDEKKLDKDCSDIDFLSNPIFVKGREKFGSHMEVIAALDPKRSNVKAESCRWLLDRLEPFRNDVAKALENEDLSEAERSKIAHDNYALALLCGEIKEEETQGYKNKSHWASMEAPVLRGSCGFSGKNGKAENSTWLGAEGEYFECPRCQGKIPSGKGIEICPHCGMRKEDAGNKCD